MSTTVVLFTTFCAFIFLSRQKKNLTQGENNKKRIISRLEVIWTVLKNLLNGRPGFDFRTLCNTEGIKKEGPLALMFGSSAFVITNQIHVAKEAMKSNDWQNRIPDDHYLHRPTLGKPLGVFFGGGEHYKSTHGIINRSLHRINFFKPRQMQKYIWTEIEEFINYLQRKMSQDRNVLSPQHMFKKSSLNIVWQLMFSKRFEYGDPTLKKLVEDTTEMNRLYGKRQWIVDLIPALNLIYQPPFLTSLDRLTKYLSNLFHPLIDEKKKEMSTSGSYEPQDFTEGFLFEMAKLDSVDSLVTEDSLKIILRDLLFAGVDTTNNALEFALLYIATNAQVYKKIMAEIDQVVGKTRLPCIEDRNKMMYTQAALSEVLRMGTVVSLTSRSNEERSHISGLAVPKGTRLVVKMFDIHHSQELWEDPLVFRPERFIGPENQLINQNNIIPFGHGKRACTGEILARAVMFIFTVTLLQRFTFDIPSELPPPSFKTYRGLSSAPHPYFLRVTKRC